MSMLRITEVSTGETEVSLRLEGKLVGTWIPEVERICLYQMNEKKKTVVLDFSSVTFIDKEGVRMLDSIKDEQLKIVNCSPFILSLLDDSMIKDQKSRDRYGGRKK